MANKADRFYFENFVQAAEQSCRLAALLSDTLKSYNAEEIGIYLSKAHEMEHLGDIKKHEMSAALAKAFVTPVDREDLDLISHNIDEVSDCIENVFQLFYVDEIRNILPEAIGFADKLVSCCTLMKSMLEEFVNFKKPAKLREMIMKLNNAEEECDKLYLDAVKAVRSHVDGTLDIVFWREIYKSMEDCADACEHVGDCIETVVMKNS